MAVPHVPAPPPPPPSPPSLSPLSPQEDDPIIIDPPNIQSELYNILERDHAALLYTKSTEIITVSILHQRLRPVLQRNRPMCGLVALCMADQIIHNDTICKGPMEVLEMSQEAGFSRQGEILSSDHLLQLAKDVLKCTGSIVSVEEILSIDIIHWLLAGEALLIPYDCDKDHTPFQCYGHAAHWCIIIGANFTLSREIYESFNLTSSFPLPPGHYCLDMEDESVRNFLRDKRVQQDILQREDQFHVFARQGKSRHLCMWKLSSLLQSCSNLYELGPHRDPKDYILPAGNLKECLKSQTVLLHSKSCSSFN